MNVYTLTVAFLILIMTTVAALAADGTAVDLAPLLQALVSLAVVAIGSLGGWAIQRLAKKLGVDRNATAMAAFDAALERAIRAGAGQMTDLIRDRGWDHVEVKNAILAAAANYAVARAGPALKAVGLDPADPGGATSAYLAAELDRLFPTAIAPVAASPVTPPLTATEGDKT